MTTFSKLPIAVNIPLQLEPVSRPNVTLCSKQFTSFV